MVVGLRAAQEAEFQETRHAVEMGVAFRPDPLEIASRPCTMRNRFIATNMGSSSSADCRSAGVSFYRRSTKRGALTLLSNAAASVPVSSTSISRADLEGFADLAGQPVGHGRGVAAAPALRSRRKRYPARRRCAARPGNR